MINTVTSKAQKNCRYELLEDTAQAIELYSQANSLAPTDPAILSKLANIYDGEGDKSQAFQCHYDVSFAALCFKNLPKKLEKFGK